MAIDFNRMQRVLIVKLRHHGDVLLISPVIQVLKNHYPHLQVDTLIYQDSQELLSGHPGVGHIYCIDKKWKDQGWRHQLVQEWQLLRQLSSQRYDLLIHLTESWRGAFLARYLRPRYAVVSDYVRRRSSGYWQRSFSHHYAQPGRLRHTVEKHLDALRALGIQPSFDERGLVLHPGEKAQARAQQWLAQNQLLPKGFIHLHPTSRWLFKCWEESRVAALIDRLMSDGIPVVLTAAPAAAEMEMIERILAQCTHRPVNLSGQLSLSELAALTGSARLFVGVDSAPMHMAAAMGTPTVALFGPSGDVEWGPWLPDSSRRIVTADPERYPCRPCGMDGCAGSKTSDCLVVLEVDTVLRAIHEVLP